AVWALSQTSSVLAGHGPQVTVHWVASIGMNLTFRMDTLTWFMVLIVGAVGALVLAYCAWYFSSGAKFLGRFAGVFVAFAGAMLGLVSTDDTLVLYVFWELTTISSYLLIVVSSQNTYSTSVSSELTTIFSYLLIGHYFDRKGSR